MLRSQSLVLAVTIGAVLVSFFLVFPQSFGGLVPQYQVSDIEDQTSLPIKVEAATSTVFFTGDVMLARHVESLLRREGSDYPYHALEWLTDAPAYVVGNFESALPRVHVKTPNFGFRFSTDPRHLEALRAAGFTHLSLANNHALDYGPDEFLYARTTLASSSFTTFGHPTSLDHNSLTYLDVGGERVAIIGLHTLFAAPGESALGELLDTASGSSTFQVVYVHWGVEYEDRPTDTERRLAMFLVEHGADLIVGHHPHVTQSVELVEGVPVFYSLGNFIFDQYFSSAVQEGLVLKLVIKPGGHELTLLPVTSIGSQAQPRLMADREREVFLSRLASISDSTLREGLLAGQLVLPHPLATLSKTAIIGE